MERWNLYIDKTYQVTPWPWPGLSWDDMVTGILPPLPHAIDDFTCYSPGDGSVEAPHVPTDMPHEWPRCRTVMAAYHDGDWLHVFVHAQRPPHPIPELQDVANEDFSLVLQMDGVERGLYFGLNEKGEGIACAQVWDVDLQPKGAYENEPWRSLVSRGGTERADAPPGIIDGGVNARIMDAHDGIAAAWRIDRRLFASALRAGALPVTVGRRCYQSAEAVSWGSCITWRPRTDRMGQFVFVDELHPQHLPVLRRVDLLYDPASETGTVCAAWVGLSHEGHIRDAVKGDYEAYVDKVTFALNGREQTVPLGPESVAQFEIPDGWNRLEILTAIDEPRVVTFQKLSGNRVVTTGRAQAAGLPAVDDVRRAFAAWHGVHEKDYRGKGTWGPEDARHYCLCHCGIFHAEPYMVACEHLGDRHEYRQRIVEACDRMLAAQHPAGWFPCRCWGPETAEQESRPGDGGAFTNGSVGEGLLMAGRLLDQAAYVDAGRRAADYAWYRWEDNQNYAAFAVWHLAMLYELEPDPATLAKAVYYAQNFASRGITTSGAQDGHNYYTAYGSITLKGMARLLEVMPGDHEFRAELRDRTLRFANQVLSRQQPSGLFAGRNRKYLGYHHLVPGLSAVAQALPETSEDIEPALLAMYRAAVTAKNGASPEHGLTIALMGRHITSHRPSPAP